MIYVDMYGRLGNQMFRYAMAKKIQNKYYPDEEIILNFNNLSGTQQNDGSFKNELENFNLSDWKIYKKSGKSIRNETDIQQKICLALVKLYLKKTLNDMNKTSVKLSRVSKILNIFGLYWNPIGYQEILYSKKKNKILSGNFESSDYFDDIYDILRVEFTPKYEVLKENIDLYNNIINSNSICLSIRRGDFVENSDISKLHNVTNLKYFQKSIQYMENKFKDPVFFIFSDDIDWAKQNIVIKKQHFFESGQDPVWEKLRLMYSCKHFIISNSTFSWWAQYLSLNKDKVVIAPKRWFNNNYNYELLEDKFIRL